MAEDLLRRHQSREARALANPTVDRQKSCYACAKSKARCDLGVPACERCRKRNIQCIYAPHTGNPNVRKARESGLMGPSQWADAQNVRGSPYLPSTSPPVYPRRESTSMQWHASLPNLHMPEPAVPMNTVATTDLSGDEPDSDSNNTIDSLDSHFTGMRWQNAEPRRSYSSVSSNEDNVYPFGVPHVSNAEWPVQDTTVPSIQIPGPSNGHALFQGQSNMPQLSGGLVDMLGRPTAPPPDAPPVKSERGAENVGMPPPSNVPALSVDALAPSLRRDMPPPPRRPSDLARLSTGGLAPGNLQLSIPHTPSRLSNVATFSPSHSAMVLGHMDLSAWLDDPVVPSPLYELGACTGWSGLMSAMDVGKTPTAHSARHNERYSLKGPRPQVLTQSDEGISAPSKSTSDSDSLTPVSPVLISSVDWWSRDEGAQERFHRYMLTTLPPHGLLRENDFRTTLAMSAISRFVTYCTFLCLAEPNAPQPPFLHRHLLVTQRNTLPEPLSVARCALSALTLRLPTSERWAWTQVATELERHIHSARDLTTKLGPCFETEMPVTKSVEQQTYLDHAESFEGAMEIMALLQAIWLYVVVGAFGDALDAQGADGQARCTLTHRVWDATLLPNAIDALQSLTHMAASLVINLQKRATPEVPGPSTQSSEISDFMWWGLCESLRRTVLASYSLLVLLRYVLNATEESSSPSDSVGIATLGLSPFPATTRGASPWASSDWRNVMAVELPAVADIFEADRAGLWRTHLDNRQHMDDSPPTLSLFHAHRPSHVDQSRSEMQFLLDSYFHQHDEFTNVCLSVLFGLTTDS